jgi:hypothetical protein
LAVLLLVGAPAGAVRPAVSREAAHPQGRFKLSVPLGWSESLMGPDELGPGAWGAVFKSTASARADEPASITVIFYAAGNPHFKDAADYLARQTEPLPVTPAGEEAGPVTKAFLGSLPGKSLTRWRPLGRPEAAVRRGERLRASLTAADGPGGFYVVTCAAPAAQWRRWDAPFGAALASFAALPAPTRPKGP